MNGEGVVSEIDGVRAYVRAIREARGISQASAAKALEIGLRTYTDWENGRTVDFKFRNMARLASVIGASVEEIADLELSASSADIGREFAAKWMSQRWPDKEQTLIAQDDEQGVDLLGEIRALQAEVRGLSTRIDRVAPEE